MPMSNDTRRRKTRYPGVSYRQRKDGSRRYSVYHGGRYLLVAGGEQEALVKQGQLRDGASRGETPVAPAKVTFAVVAEHWFASKHRLRPYTRINYRATLDRILIPRFGAKKIAAITKADIVGLIYDLEKQGLAATTITDYMKPLCGTLKYAVEEGLITANPCSRLSRDDRPRAQSRKADHVWSDEEMAALIAAAEYLARRPEARADYTPLLRVALATGLRLGELLGLQWGDVDLPAGELHVRRQWTRLGEYAEPKTKAALRRVPLSADVVKYLAEFKLRSTQSNDGDPLFASKLGRPLTHRNASRRGFEKAAEHAEIEGVSFHDMRHAFASRMIDRGISSTVLAKILGHESSTITERRYIHLFDRQRTDDAVREAMAW
ncbi:MAG: site-specific integrase [Actinobacteria bacterium]|nr:site-specific integrase [Actinomycetota bacterium]